jgi:uncharacterized protein (TIGR01777 family)
MRIAITGATGFIGTRLHASLREAGHHVVTVGRRRQSGESDVTWDPPTGTIDAIKLRGIDAVVHLAGESIAQRWTTGARRAIQASRVQGTGLIARTVAALDPKPSVLVAMSGVGIYGDCGEDVVDETRPHGLGFLAETAQLWEASANPARAAGIRVVHPRLGIALHRSGGALERLLPIFSLGVGGRIGSGKQWMPWIALSDVLEGLRFMIEHPSLMGPVNLVSPWPVRNAEFTRVLARVLHRPALAMVPEFAVRLAFGQMGVETVIGGQRAVPVKLTGAGFEFRHGDLESALREAIL